MSHAYVDCRNCGESRRRSEVNTGKQLMDRGKESIRRQIINFEGEHTLRRKRGSPVAFDQIEQLLRAHLRLVYKAEVELVPGSLNSLDLKSRRFESQMGVPEEIGNSFRVLAEAVDHFLTEHAAGGQMDHERIHAHVTCCR